MLTSPLFRDNVRLQRCLVEDQAHLTIGSSGIHVALVQHALVAIDHALIDESEIKSKHYGKSTANAVLQYKQSRKIINLSYQKSVDNIVGRMTIAALDAELNTTFHRNLAKPPKTLLERPVQDF